MRSRIIILCCIAVLLSDCAVNPVTGKKDLMLISEQDEIRMGQESDPVIVESFGLYKDQALQTMIDRLGQEMAAISHRPHLKYEFKVLDSPVVNAFALPGGYVYFTRGILAHFNSEAEFAGVLGHEIGHITARHSAKQYSSNLLAQVGLITGMIIAPEFAQFSQLTQQALGLMFLKFSRDHESQSDWLGVDYSTAIGYDAHQMADFFQTIDRLTPDGGALPDFLSTHPNPVDRYNAVHELADGAQAQSDFKTFLVKREEYYDLIDGIVYGEDPRQGFEEEGIFYHPNGRYQFPVPSEWESAISLSRVLFGPESGDAIIVFGPEKANTLQEALATSVEDLKLTVISQSTERINGFDALLVEAKQQNPQPPYEVYPFTICFYQDGGTVYRSLGVATEEAWPTHKQTLMQTVIGFERLTDVRKLNVKPDRVKIVSTSQRESLGNAFKGFGVADDDLESVALLNGMELEDMVDAGSRIKIIRSE